MTNTLRIFCTVITVFAFASLQAQPMEGDLYRYGCHYSKSKIPSSILAEMEKGEICGSNARSDSLDILNFNISLDLRNFTQQLIYATCEITFTARQDNIEFLPLDLLALTIDSITWQDSLLAYDYDDLLLNVHLPLPLNVGDTMKVRVHYHGKPTPDNYWGGFKFENGIAYNLGIGLTSNPYNMGRSWHPCFDNFVERATYDIGILTNEGRKGYAIGEFLGETALGNGDILRQYHMPLPLPSYLVGVAASKYEEVHKTHPGAYGDRPMLLVGKPTDIQNMKEAFTYLGDAVDMLEAWFGPYVWGQVGYVMTEQGAMEHASLIAFPVSSISNGPTFGMSRLMAHELGHHWWGNITTMSCPDNMWIKEGNAEYSAHLFFEYVYGKEVFRDIVKGNHYDVLKNAHIDDGAYLPLSGLPYENTYGTHTYYKGASVMHNLRGYLGDTLFRQGMRSILDTYHFEVVDAELFRDQLTANTGVDMAPFFDDWIYSPGYAMFELDSVSYSCTNPTSCTATVYVQQKLHKAPHFHTNVPLEIAFYDKDMNAYTAQFMASGEYSEATLALPFEPIWQILNEGNKLNLARMQSSKVVKATGNISLPYCDLVNPTATNVTDSALVSFIHFWGAADPGGPEQEEVQLSGTHYWRYGGILPPDFRARVTLAYDGSTPNNFDYDLANGTAEDSLILAWRPKPGVPWGEFPFYKKIPFTANDGKGFMRVDTLLPGDYAFAKGSLPLATAVVEEQQAQPLSLKVFPNPSAAGFTLQAELPTNNPLTVSLFDAMGRQVRQQRVQVNAGLLFHHMETSGLPPGVYWLKIEGTSGTFRLFEKLMKI